MFALLAADKHLTFSKTELTKKYLARILARHPPKLSLL
jgi:hypothetical protein